MSIALHAPLLGQILPALRRASAVAATIAVIALAGASFGGLVLARTWGPSFPTPALPDADMLPALGGLLDAALALLAINAWLHARQERAALRRLAATMAAQAAAASPPALAEDGPPAVAHLARAINASRRREAQRTAEHLDVLASFAHDLRTPLTRLGLRCERVRDDAERAAIERDLAELGALVDGSLACARSLRVAEPLRRVDADGLLDCLVGDYQDSGRTLRVEGRVGQPVLTCPKALRRVLVNLIDNGLRHGSDVRLSVRREARRLVLAVVDSGPGIPPDELDAVFAPWYCASGKPQRGDGSGLGLAIARRLAQAMHAELQLENRRGGGLEARLTLPLGAA